MAGLKWSNAKWGDLAWGGESAEEVFPPAPVSFPARYAHPLGSNTSPYNTWEKAARSIANLVSSIPSNNSGVIYPAGEYIVGSSMLDTTVSKPNGRVVGYVGADTDPDNSLFPRGLVKLRHLSTAMTAYCVRCRSAGWQFYGIEFLLTGSVTYNHLEITSAAANTLFKSCVFSTGIATIAASSGVVFEDCLFRENYKARAASTGNPVFKKCDILSTTPWTAEGAGGATFEHCTWSSTSSPILRLFTSSTGIIHLNNCSINGTPFNATQHGGYFQNESATAKIFIDGVQV